MKPNTLTIGADNLVLADSNEEGAKLLALNTRQQLSQTALSLAREFQPTAITLDVFLPDMLGWTVLNSLKLDPATRHIPVQMLSVEAERQHGLSHGAFAYLVKPATTEDLEHAFGSDGAGHRLDPGGRRGCESAFS